MSLHWLGWLPWRRVTGPGAWPTRKKKKREKSTPKTLRGPSLSKERGPNEKKKKKRKNWKILNAYRGQVKGKQVRCTRDGSGGT